MQPSQINQERRHRHRYRFIAAEHYSALQQGLGHFGRAEEARRIQAAAPAILRKVARTDKHENNFNIAAN